MSDGETVLSNGHETVLDEKTLLEQSFKVPLSKLYRVAVHFFRAKEKEDLLLTLAYEDRVQLMALSKQVNQGPCSGNSSIGFFDLMGNDTRQAWIKLGKLDREEAMTRFVSLFDRVCPVFKDHVDAQLQQIADAEKQDEQKRQQETVRNCKNIQSTPFDAEKFELQRRHIQEALNQQTQHQFRAYAEQQFAGDLAQQEALIRQLQEQHYQQYMAQVYAQQAAVQGVSLNGSVSEQVNSTQKEGSKDSDDVSDDEPASDLPSNPTIAPASLWNRQDIVDFKAAIRKEGGEGILKIGHGETVTVRVPTHEEGTCLFWEFATDHYDIGFGVLFEWTIAESNQVSVHISESDDEEGEEELEGARPTAIQPGDVETGAPRRVRDPNKPYVDEIMPVYRRDCHEEVYAGSHVYPARGVYLLKFDNSYSLWRSKTLYYRVYYSK